MVVICHWIHANHANFRMVISMFHVNSTATSTLWVWWRDTIRYGIFNVIAVPALATSLHAPVRLVVRFGFRLGFGLESGG